MADVNTPFETEVKTWDGIEAIIHRFGGTEFQWGSVEIGHIHWGGMLDIPFTRRIRTALVDAQLALPHHLLPETGWVTFYIHTPADIETAIVLMRLSYIHKRRRLGQAEFDAELAALPLPDTVKWAAKGQPLLDEDAEE